MEVLSTSHSFNRPVTQSKNSSDRQFNDDTQAAILEDKAQERAVEQRTIQEKLKQQKEDSQRRLDGRLITFGYDQNAPEQQQQVSFNRSRVNEAYNPSAKESTANQDSQQPIETEQDAIDIVV